MKHIIIAAAFAAVPLVAQADDAGDVLAALKPECAKPVAELTVAQIEECRMLYRMVSHFGDAFYKAHDREAAQKGR